MTDKKDNELARISKTREMATFVKILNKNADNQNSITKSLVEFANNVHEILDCYESIIVREKSSGMIDSFQLRAESGEAVPLSEVSKKLGIKEPDKNDNS